MNAGTESPNPNDFEIELGRANDLLPCECCGASTRIVRGFVYKAGTARAVYLVRSTLGAHHRDADVAVSVGGWCDADPSHRQLVTLSLRQLEQGPAFMVVDAKDTAWGGEEDLGEPMRRGEVVGTPLSREVFGILDAVALQDQRVHGWRLASPPAD